MAAAIIGSAPFFECLLKREPYHQLALAKSSASTLSVGGWVPAGNLGGGEAEPKASVAARGWCPCREADRRRQPG